MTRACLGAWLSCLSIALAVCCDGGGHRLTAQPIALPAARDAKGDAKAEYERRFRDYAAARQTYEESATAYWSQIVAKRRARVTKLRDRNEMSVDDYVMSQPPVYSGPPRPVDPAAPQKAEPETPRAYVPVVADFLTHAKEHFGVAPRRPKTEAEYKRAYVDAARAAGLTRDQVVRIYMFEVGGDGTYDLQAGLEYKRQGARAVSTALGYNQLLNTNSVGLMAEKGDQFLKALRTKSARIAADPGLSRDRKALDDTIAVVARMVAFCRTVPDDWTEHDKLANTEKGLGVHAMLLDLDVGPLLQVQKLVDSLAFARRRGYQGAMSAAELEMMNLTGDGNGYDMLVMPAALRAQVPTSNFFSRASYQRNPVVIRNNTVAKLLVTTNAQMDRAANASGARDLAALF